MADPAPSPTGFLSRFMVLRGAVRELWLVFGAKVLAILAYGVMNLTLALWLSSGYSNFSVVDLTNPSALAAKLNQPDPADGVSLLLRTRLSETNRVLLADPVNLAKVRLRRVLVEELNRVIRTNTLLKPQHLSKVQLSPETRALQSSAEERARAGQTFSPSETAHLVRSLLQDAYPAEIARTSTSGLSFSDENAGFIIAAWSMMMTLFTVMVGSLVDAIGLRKAFLAGFCVCLVARGFLTFATSRVLTLGLGLLPLALGEALMTPVMVAAIRRYSTTAQRSIAFSIFYAMMNVGFLIGGLIFDYVRRGLGEYGHFTLPIFGLDLSTYRMLFLLSFLLTLPNLLIVYFCLRNGVEATDTGVQITTEKPKYPAEALLRAFTWTIRDALHDTVRIFSNLWRQPAFYKFLAFLSLVVAVRLIGYHMNYTYPKFGIRELGEGAPVGRLWAINQVLIIILVPIVGALTQRIAAYRMVVVGSAVSALSVFIMALPTAWFQALADGFPGQLIAHTWLGMPGGVHPYYVMIFLYVVVLSLGEALWSPRVYEYTASIAPKGQEASYMSLSYLPFFVAKLFVGSLSGLMLARYCPEAGARHSQTLWLLIALPTIITPLGLLALRRYIRVQEAGREERG